MPAASSTAQLRSAAVVETTPGTTPASPGFKTFHTPAIFDDSVTRYHQPSLVAGGALIGDALLEKPVKGKISNAPMVYGLYDTLFESLFQATFSTNVLLDGKSRQALTFENAIPAGLAGSLTMKRYLGVEAIGTTINASARDGIKCSFDLMGMQSQATSTTALAGATYTDPTNNDAFSSNTDIGTITFAGYTLDDLASLDMSFTYEGREEQPKLGTDALAGITRGTLRVSIAAKFYLQTNFAAMYDAAQTTLQTAAKITVNLGSISGKKYRFEFWNAHVDLAAPDFSGATAFQMVTITGVYSAANTGVITMTRAL